MKSDFWIRVSLVLVVSGILAIGLVAGGMATTASAQPGPVGTTQGELVDGHFLENLGQWDPEARFRSGGNGAEVWFAPARLMYTLYRFPNFGEASENPGEPGADDPQIEAFADASSHTVEVEFLGAKSEVEIVPGEAHLGEHNWITADHQASGAKEYKSLTYQDLWNGVDLEFHGSRAEAGTVKTVFVVSPGADPSQIALRYDGQTGLDIDGDGNLVIDTQLGSIVEAAPIAFTANGERVSVSYNLTGSTVTFVVGNYDSGQTLYIDPLVIFSRDFGGLSQEMIGDIKENANGRYVSGSTFSTDFPTGPGFDLTATGTPEWFVIQFNTANTTRLASTYLGGSSSDYGSVMELMANGDVIVAGHTFGQTFPGPGGAGIAPAPANTTQTTSYNAAIARLNSTLTTLVDSAMFGGNNQTALGGLAFNSTTSEFYLAGQTFSSVGVGGLGPAGGFMPNFQVTPEGFVTRLSSDFNTATAFTFLGGNSTDGLTDVDVDAAGTVYTGGFTFSTVYNFFTRTAVIGPGNNGTQDFIVARLNPALNAFTYISQVGGASTDGFIGTSYFAQTFGAIGKQTVFPLSTGQLVFTGCTLSTDYPIAGAPFQAANGGNYDQAISIINPGGTALDESTYLGGTSTDEGSAVEQNALGNMWVTGLAASANFPVLNAVQGTNGGNYDFTLTLFDGVRNLSALIGSTYWGGNSTDFGWVIADGPQNFRARVVGPAFSTNYPQVPAGSPTFGTGGSYDGGIVDINFGGANVNVENQEVIAQPIDPSRTCLTAGDYVLYVFDLVNSGLDAQPDNPGPEFEASLAGPQTGYGCTADAGTCTMTGSSATWNGTIPAGGQVHIEVRARVNGGVRAGTELCFSGVIHYDSGVGSNDQSRTFAVCRETDCPPTVSPNAALSGQVHLPILNFQGQNDACRSWLEVQNIGDEFSKAALVVWGEPGFCPPQCAGPLKVECSGLLKPGSTWNFMSPTQVPNGSKSGILFSFTARQLSDINVDLGFDDIVADVLCETLFFGVVGDCDDYRRFKKAYNEGLEFAGIPLDRAIGSVLAVEVLRHCPGDQTPGAEVSSKYAGIAGIDLGAYDPVFGGYAYYVPLLYAQSADYNSVMYIQNGGLECSSVEIWFKAQDDCLRARICEIFTLAPGETYQFDSNDCVGPDFQGSAWLRSSQPMGIAVDIFGRDVLMTYVGIPTELNYTFNPNEALFSTGNQVAYGPLIYSEYQGWDSGVQVQNMSSVTAAKVKIYFLDRSGDVITTLIDWVCPRGSQTFFLPVVADLPGTWVGSIRVESQEWFSPGDPLVAPPNISGIVMLTKYTDAARSDTAEAIAYNLLTEQRAYDWQIGFGGGGLDSGIGLIAIPSVLKDLDNTGVTAELAIANLVPKPGFTDFAIYIYDQNGLVDYVCQKLNEKQVEYISFEAWGYLNPGFKGSAIISAVFWEHDVFDDDGFFLRNVVGLAAVIVERTGTRLGEDIPGDEAAGTAGIPFREFETEDDEFFFDFEGPVVPLCPGVGFRAPPGDCATQGLGDGLVLEIEAGPPFSNFPRGNPCINTGVNARNFGTHDFFICAAGEYTMEIVSVTLTPFNGASCGLAGEDVLAAVFFGPEGFNPNNSCENHIVSNSDTFDAMGPGDTFTFDLPDADSFYTLMIQNNCDTTPPQSVGPIEFNLNPD